MFKVLFQSREDAFTNWGGDTTQMQMTKKYLEKLGCSVEIDLTVKPDLSPKRFDVVHVFNVQTADHGLQQVQNAKAYNIPIALSTIYWNMDHIYVAGVWRRLFRAIYDSIPLNFFESKSFLQGLPIARRKMKQLKIRNMLFEADVLFPNSYAEGEQLVTDFGLPAIRSKSVLVTNGIEPIEEVGNQSENHIDLNSMPDNSILQVGRIEPIKGQLNVIKGLMGHPEIPLVFLGAVSDIKYMEACLAYSTKRGNTFFFDPVPQAKVYNFFKKAKVHILPSLRESPGLVTLEAGLNNVNCVVSYHGPVAEYFGDNVWYCDPESQHSIAEALLSAYQSPTNSDFKNSIIENFTWEKAAEQSYRGYRSILRKKGAKI